MDILNVALVSFFSLIMLFLLTKLMGYKQVSELTMFDYINGITIGSIAAEMATSLESDFLKPLTAMVIYALVVVVISKVTQKSVAVRRFIVGKSIILMDNGKIFKKNFGKAKIDINEFLVECRIAGVFNIDNIQTAIMEPTGHISILQKSDMRPVIPKDIGNAPPMEYATINVILDGKVLSKNLKQTGNDEQWLKKELKKQGISSIEDVFIAYCDSNNKLSAYKAVEEAPKNDIFK